LKFYSDVRVEVSKSLAKEGDVTYGNITKLKAIKNKMSAPYRTSQFEIVYGQGIDKFTELMEMADDLELGRKYGQTYTFDGVKYSLEEFKMRMQEECDFFDQLKQKIVTKLTSEEQEEESQMPDPNLLEVIEEEIVQPNLFTENES
jgi:recombination protein RecA